MCWKLCETPIETQRVSPCNYAIKPYNEREVVGPFEPMKLCNDIYFIPKFHILETGTVKLSIKTGLSSRVVGIEENWTRGRQPEADPPMR
jgi:hypothetical protein